MIDREDDDDASDGDSDGDQSIERLLYLDNGSSAV